MSVDLGRSLATEATHESTCRACDARVVWAFMDASGKRNALDRPPHPDGLLVVVGWQVTDYGFAPVVEHLRGELVQTHSGPRYESHFATCETRSG